MRASDSTEVSSDEADRIAHTLGRGTRSRGARTLNTSYLEVSIGLPENDTQRIVDPNQRKGLVLTGTRILHYAKLIKLEPLYETTLASYSAQAKLQQQLIAEYEGALRIKDQKVVVLNEIIEAHEQRADLYKQIAEVQENAVWERAIRKLAFPVGITVGLLAGLILSN